MLALLLAAQALPLPLTPTEQGELRCVATLAIVAEEQKARRWSTVPPVAVDGARYAGRVGEALVARGRSVEQVRDWMIAAVAVTRREPVRAEQVTSCLAQARARLAAPAPR